ncbi:MAG TPA: alpha-L-fucosidase [Tepidisphaeraceae bacterium]|nr:alpha-L-fucosidase [Tepidisphaeraceae bacterium]
MRLSLRMLGLVTMGVCLAGVVVAGPPQPLQPVPTPSQLAWQRGELSLFLHFGVNTFTNREWGEGKEDPRIFNPSKLDARQWAAAAKAGGFKLAILTAKHHDGFCLWPSKYTDHSVKSSPWRNGQGDVVREFVDAFREQGIKVGLYLSPWDRHEKCYGDSPAYNQYYKNQLAELLTNYGSIAEVWFDGACGEGPNGKKQVYDFPGIFAAVRKLQPQAVMFSDAGPDVRWIGNEQGTAGDPCWATVDPRIWVEPGKAADGAREPNRSLQHGDKGGSTWRPGESDVSIRPGWFWHKSEDAKVRSVENLIDLYFKSVGRNSLLLLNVPPNTDGLVSDADVKRLAEFRARLDEIFKTDLAAGQKATASNTRQNDAAFSPDRVLDGNPDTYWATDDDQTSGWVEVDLGEPRTFNIACMQEAIALGQRLGQLVLVVLVVGG